jgi:hypothetical protein
MKWPPTPAPTDAQPEPEPDAEVAGTAATVEPADARSAVPAPSVDLVSGGSADPAHALEVGDEELRPFEGVVSEEPVDPAAPAPVDEAEHRTP